MVRINIPLIFRLIRRVYGHIRSRIKNVSDFVFANIAVITLIAITLILIHANYTPGTFLTGWDTLHPEFNFKEYWSRMVFGAWQEHQALGSVATQAHASEIPRVVILNFLDIFLSVDQLRYAYAFLMLLIGPLGVYLFVKRTLLNKVPDKASSFGGFMAGLFYLLNLGTLQHFYVPLEMFLVHYGFIGWIFLFASQYYWTGDRKPLLWFFGVTLLATPQSHTSTLFYAYVINLGAFFGILLFFDLVKFIYYKLPWVAKRYALISRRIGMSSPVYLSTLEFYSNLQRFMVIMIATITLNSFWFLPNIYFAINHGREIQQSKIHALFSEEAFLQNKEFGNIEDTAIIRNFLFNWGEHVGNNEFGELLDEWKQHHQRRMVLDLGYYFFGVVVAGIVVSLLSKNWFGFSLFTLFAVSIFFLFNVNPPFGKIFLFFQENLPLFREAFRFPFTKFSIILMFTYAGFLGYFFGSFGDLLERVFTYIPLHSTLYGVMAGIMIYLFGYYMYPAFEGNLISDSMKVDIPDRYFELFDHLDSQDEFGRVANLPIQSFWGWAYYDWEPDTGLGYQGAGFLWFGIKQPLMDREFDRWNILNEQYYREMSLAVYSRDVEMMEKVLEKFKIKWVFLDESVTAPGNDQNILFYDEINKLLSSSLRLTLERDFGEGLKLYRFDPGSSYSLIEYPESFVYSKDLLLKEYTDPIYKEHGDYVYSGDSNYPYLGITEFDESIKSDLIRSDDTHIYLKNKLTGFSIASEGQEKHQFRASVEKTGEGVRLNLESINEVFSDQKVSIDLETELLEDSYLVVIDEDYLVIDTAVLGQDGSAELGVISLPPESGLDAALYYPTYLERKAEKLNSVLETCSITGTDSVYSIQYYDDGFDLYARDVEACITLKLDDLVDIVQGDSYFQITYDNVDFGARPKVCLLDDLTGLCVNTPLEDGSSIGYVDGGRMDDYFIRFFALGVLSAQEKGVGYRNIQVRSYDLEEQRAVDLSGFSDLSGSFDELKFKKYSGYSGNVTYLRYSPRICNTGGRDFEDSFAVIEEDSHIRYESHGDSLCDSFEFPFIKHDVGHLLEVRARNLSGVPLRICLTNEFSKRCDIYVSLGFSPGFETKYYLVPPMGTGNGYTVNVSNLTFGSSSTINELEYIGLIPFTYDYLRSLQKEAKGSGEEELLIYNQAYETGWRAMCGLDICDAKHVMVNNWANGWIFDNGYPLDNVRIIFWPQGLEYLGFLLIAGTYGATMILTKKKESEK